MPINSHGKIIISIMVGTCTRPLINWKGSYMIKSSKVSYLVRRRMTRRS